MQPILTVTLNPAVDVTTSVSRLEPSRKLRCVAPRFDPGGGGVNVSRVIKELGGQSRAFLAAGGGVGEQLRALLDTAGLDYELWPIDGETRFSLTVMEETTGLHYRFVLPGPELAVDSADALLQRLTTIVGSGYAYVVASGGLPPGLPVDVYGRLARIVRAAGARLIVDTHGEALRAAIAERPYLVRINHLEAQELIGGSADAAAHLLGRELVRRGMADAAIVTLGERGAIVATRAGETEIRPPVVAVRSTVGAGDSFVGALVLGLARGWPLDLAARYGVAAAAATVTTEATQLCEAATVERHFAAIGGVHPPGELV